MPPLALTVAQEQRENKGVLLLFKCSDTALHELTCALGAQHAAKALRFTRVSKEVDIALLETS